MLNAANADVLIGQFGSLGVGIAMFLQSSIVPIPWELVIFTATSCGISLLMVVIFGSIGVTLGACLGYALGRFGGLPLIERYGKYFFINTAHIVKMEALALRYGVFSVLVARALPVVPFKIFSVAAGIIKIPFTQFVVCTMLGMAPRIVLIGGAGVLLSTLGIPGLCGLLAMCVLVYFIWKYQTRAIKEIA
jgi:membrane protein DedA with SNARE-associated domain